MQKDKKKNKQLEVEKRRKYNNKNPAQPRR
jgi:hypothetical protein